MNFLLRLIAQKFAVETRLYKIKDAQAIFNPRSGKFTGVAFAIEMADGTHECLTMSAKQATQGMQLMRLNRIHHMEDFLLALVRVPQGGGKIELISVG